VATVLIWTLVLYALGASGFLLLIYRRQSADDPTTGVAASLSDADKPLAERIQLLNALSEYRKQTARWYEKAFSTMGVVALVTMTVAAAVQTIRAALEDQKVQQVQVRADAMAARIAESELLVESLTRSVMNRASRTLALTEDEERILKHRLQTLSAGQRPAPAQLQEMVDVSLLLRDYDHAVHLVETYPEVMQSAKPIDQVTIAEYYYLVGSERAASSVAERVWNERGSLPDAVLQRLLVVRALLGADRAEAADELARANGLPADRARQTLDAAIASFVEGAARLRSSRSGR
jgi:hypothetical protein